MALRLCDLLPTIILQRDACRAWKCCHSIQIGGDTDIGVKDTVLQLSKDIKADAMCCKYESANIRPYSSSWY
jgi:hypothetical protein